MLDNRQRFGKSTAGSGKHTGQASVEGKSKYVTDTLDERVMLWDRYIGPSSKQSVKLLSVSTWQSALYVQQFSAGYRKEMFLEIGIPEMMR